MATTATQVEELRKALELPPGKLTPRQRQSLSELMKRVHGDLDLALTALTMEPRPTWVNELCGTIGT